MWKFLVSELGGAYDYYRCNAFSHCYQFPNWNKNYLELKHMFKDMIWTLALCRNIRTKIYQFPPLTISMIEMLKISSTDSVILHMAMLNAKQWVHLFFSLLSNMMNSRPVKTLQWECPNSMNDNNCSCFMFGNFSIVVANKGNLEAVLLLVQFLLAKEIQIRREKETEWTWKKHTQIVHSHPESPSK